MYGDGGDDTSSASSGDEDDLDDDDGYGGGAAAADIMLDEDAKISGKTLMLFHVGCRANNMVRLFPKCSGVRFWNPSSEAPRTTWIPLTSLWRSTPLDTLTTHHG